MFKNLVQGALGNYSEVSVRELIQEYGDFLLTDETISSGYKLVRDALIFTNYRMIFVDKQGATGKKTAYHTIYLDGIVDVTIETAGFGIDDSEIKVTVLENVYHSPPPSNRSAIPISMKNRTANWRRKYSSKMKH